MEKRKTVLIPIVPSTSRRSDSEGDRVEGELIEVFSQLYSIDRDGRDDLTDRDRARIKKADSKAREKDWDPVAAQLRRNSPLLYESGCAAAGVVRKLGIKRPLWACYQWFRPQSWVDGQRLQAVNPRGPDEGKSAQLGLALALLMRVSSTPVRQVIATGVLIREPSSFAPTRSVEPGDNQVLPVGKLQSKLKLVRQYAIAGHLDAPRQNGELLFFAPCYYEKDGQYLEVALLPEVQSLKEQGIRVVPVESLNDAVARLQLKRSHYLPRDRICQGVFSVLLLMSISTGAWFVWKSLPIPMSFLAGDMEAEVREPFQVCRRNAIADDWVPLGREGIVPVIPTRGTIGWNVAVGDPNTFDAKLGRLFDFGGYYVAAVMVADFSASKVHAPIVETGDGAALLRISPGSSWEWQWPLNEQAEMNALVLLAQRHAPFNADTLHRNLIDRFPESLGQTSSGVRKLDVTAAVNFLINQAPGALAFKFQSKDGIKPCLD